MAKRRLILTNGKQSTTFLRTPAGYRPEWFRLGTRPMLRFKDHEFLNIGNHRVLTGQLLEEGKHSLLFGDEIVYAGVEVAWLVRVALPEDGKRGFTVTTRLIPTQEDIEVLEAMSCFETPYEYDGTEEQMTVMAQQPVFRFRGGEQDSGVGYNHPFWYYGKVGRAHLSYPSSSPLYANRVCNADGSNERCTLILGNWTVTSSKDMFSQPTRPLHSLKADVPFPDSTLDLARGRRGMKFLIGAYNWNTSLHKDCNVLVEAGTGLTQELTLDYAARLPKRRWDLWLSGGWERLLAMHFPRDGHVPAYQVARSRGASWVEAAEWLTDQFQRGEGCPGFFHPENGIHVYAPNTRPRHDKGVKVFCGQWTGPVAYLGRLWKDRAIQQAADRLEGIFIQDKHHTPERIGTIGPTPQYVAALRKDAVAGLSKAGRGQVRDWLKRRVEYVLNPRPGERTGDGGVLAWDAFASLLAADRFEKRFFEDAARDLIERMAAELEENFWAFNCAAKGDMVSCGQARPFGHGLAMAASLLAHQRFGETRYLEMAERFANLLTALHFIPHNNAESPDLDTRGWANGSTGGRDQYCNLPPWETAFALEQLAYMFAAGLERESYYDLFWLFSHTGLAMFPKARTHKRLYTPERGITYRPIDAVATERAFYLSLPYMAYEEPWDQAMLAGYQGVEPIVLALLCGGGLVESLDDRVLALVPEAATYDCALEREIRVRLWNPTAAAIDTSLRATVAAKRGDTWTVSGAIRGTVSRKNPVTRPVTVPPRQATVVTFRRGRR